MLQLHGKETPERVAEVKARYGLPVMKAFSIRDAADLEAIAPYLGIADRFLFDAKPPKGSELPGGNGVSFDWRLLARLDPKLDYMLSGGLNADNIGEALGLANPPGIDISSGVESAPGVKDAGADRSVFPGGAGGGEPAAPPKRSQAAVYFLPRNGLSGNARQVYFFRPACGRSLSGKSKLSGTCPARPAQGEPP